MSERNREFVTEFFFHPLNWPQYALDILLSKDFTRTKRCALAAFFIGNGMVDPYVAERLIEIYNSHYTNTATWQQRLKEFTDLFYYLDKPVDDPDRSTVRMNYFYYDMNRGTTLYLNGNKKENTR